MKPKELRTKSDSELNEMLKKLKFDMMKEKGGWTIGTPEEKSLRKNAGKSGQKTSMQKNIRKLIAQIKTIQNERRLK